ncbi:DUF561 domain-containing protein [Lentilactobacillus senioris]|uniref:DUF561 domain-containing protein n=1 Tax=Lentilactobacillus senioris TaxID=931534 RepID=UPI002281AD06|nr:DUF561 domain-containing protein [Lentilactobacillus senioris]MCY9807425.1 DUF561 domain-containing protein [Lentilactobacillus senioris]
MNSITRLLGTKYPLIQGSLAHISTYPLVAAVSNAGGLGTLSSTGLNSKQLALQIQRVKELTNQPFAVNLTLLDANVETLVKIVIEQKVPIVITSAGTPKRFIPALKTAGIKTLAVIPNVKIAKKMESLGVDAVIAEGMESGGHIGQLTTMGLVPQVVAAVNIPVIAAGGIADARGVLAVQALGAQGIQVGTAFLVAEETPIAPEYKQAVITADDMATVVTGNGADAVRGIANGLTDRYFQMIADNAWPEELDKLTTGSLQRAIHGDVATGSLMAGQVAGMITKVEPAATIVKRLMNKVEA